MTTKTDILLAIRRKCLDCCCSQPGEVRLCPLSTCDLWPYRFGRDPEPSQSRGFAKHPVYTEGFGKAGPSQANTPAALPEAF